MLVVTVSRLECIHIEGEMEWGRAGAAGSMNEYVEKLRR